MVNKEKIILAITPDVKLYECFLENLKYIGFEVYLICNNHFSYRSFKDKLVNFYKNNEAEVTLLLICFLAIKESN